MYPVYLDVHMNKTKFLVSLKQYRLIDDLFLRINVSG